VETTTRVHSGTEDDTTQHMQCMEVWGGNRPVETGMTMPGLDAWVYCRPFENADAGGDVYYVSSCATGRITRLLVADVSGHGQAVCETADGLQALMRRFVNHLDQTKFVSSMNGQFVTMAAAGCFATAVVTTFFAPTNELSLCVAGHPPPLLYRAREGKWEYLRYEEVNDGANVPLGIIDLSEYEQFNVRLRVGDLVLCYTDSLVEARGRDGEMLGLGGLLQILQSMEVGDAHNFISRLLAEIDARTDGGLRNDDVTGLLFRPNGTAPTKPLKERLLAPFRIGREIVKSIRQGKTLPFPEFSVVSVGGAMWSRLSYWRRGKSRKSFSSPGTPGEAG
jgi:sigma-B regulation protein RsbU (phosphoserine phosphatase)